MRRSNKLRTWETAALLALCLTLLSGTWASARQRSIAGDVLRLHVIAASDDGEEQALKLRVRDAVLDYLRPRLAHAGSAQEARAILEKELENLARAAERCSEGRSVSVSLGREDYPSRSYGSYTLPAGRYESLRVVLGQGQGHNWWCIVFPPLCLEAVETTPLQDAMGEENYAIVSGREGYELRFWLVELWGELLGALRGKP